MSKSKVIRAPHRTALVENIIRFYVGKGKEGFVHDFSMAFFFNELFSIFSGSNGPETLGNQMSTRTRFSRRNWLFDRLWAGQGIGKGSV